MNDRDTRAPPSPSDLAGDDFLFHLYRGSELLQDDRVHDAKAELETALARRPSDPKGQDLLGIVYFRLGLYPRAIAIYERLVAAHPEASTPRVNLALCYLKTGQPGDARLELERVVDRAPDHARAWGYLGLAYQRLGDLERAGKAFARAGNDGKARRVLEMAAAPGSSRLAAARPSSLSLRPEPARPDSFRPIGGPPDPASGRAPVVVLPAEPRLPSTHEPPPPKARPGAPRMGQPTSRPPTIHPPASSSSRPPVAASAADAAAFARDRLLVFPRDGGVAQHSSGLVLVRVASSFAARVPLVRSLSFASVATSMIPRRTRGRELDEPLGGPEEPLLSFEGRGELVLGPPEGKRLAALAVTDTLYLREALLAGFEPSLSCESGRVAIGDGDAISMVLLRGHGAAVAVLAEEAVAVEVTADRPTTLRAATITGWIGRLVPRALLQGEAPAGARGLIAFSGEGMVLFDVR
jgi:hypothetical protein